MRRSYGALLVVVVIGLIEAQELTQPNILFILADDLGYNDISLHGSQHIRTPNIDAIARNGVQFTSGYSLAGDCSPARAGFLTGRNPASFGHTFNPPHTHENSKAGLPRGQVIIPQVLERAGYETSIIGKWHLGFHSFFYPLKRGFSHFYGFLGGRFDYFKTEIFVFPFQLWEYLYDRFSNPKETKHLTIQFTDEAIDFTSRSHAARKPFFLYLAYNAPHGPLDFIPEDVDQSIPQERVPYAAMITRLDLEIGRLITHLQTLGILENTLVVFSNDNGGQLFNEASNAPYRGNKGSFLDGGVRVPLFMQWDGKIRAGRTIDHPVTLMDMFPTFQNIAGVPNSQKKRNLHGVDLMPYIPRVGGGGHRTDPPHEYIVMSTLDEGMIRRGPYKLFVKSLIRNETFLYNLDTDVGERRNIRKRKVDLHDELYDLFMRWYSKNPAPVFPEELRSNPLRVTFDAPQGPYERNTPILFKSAAFHAEGKSLSYQWEVFRPGAVHMATFQLIRHRSAPITSPNAANTSIRFTKGGKWIVRLNVQAGDFVKWHDYPLTVR